MFLTKANFITPYHGSTAIQCTLVASELLRCNWILKLFAVTSVIEAMHEYGPPVTGVTVIIGDALNLGEKYTVVLPTYSPKLELYDGVIFA